MKRSSLAALLLIASATSSTSAQPADHELHHLAQQNAPATAQPSSPAGPSGMTGPGMMGPGMMGGGSQGMMGGRGMMDMMGGNMPMMNMMIGRAQGSECGMGGMGTIDHVEGRIAFLRAELKITDSQSAAWSAFADALRTNAKSLAEVRASMIAETSPQTLVDRLTLQEKWLAARLEGTRAIKSALTNLVGTFSDEQKKTADELLAPHMGMNQMACAMRAGQMGGPTQPGMMMQGR
jgi:hypothetical protein